MTLDALSDREQAEHLRHALAEATTPPEWFDGFGKRQSRLLGALVNAGGRVVTLDGLVAAMCFDRPDCDWPETSVVKVYVYHIRRRLARIGAPGRIEAVRDLGYRWAE